MTDAELQAIRERCEAATNIGFDPGWEHKLDASQSDVPALLAEIERLKAVMCSSCTYFEEQRDD